jgi:transaldolase/glucose-6-phosphate isomerase
MNPPEKSRKSLRGSGRHLSHDDFHLGPCRAAFEDRLRAWETEGYVARLWAKDPALWASGPTAEISDRLGWLELPGAMEGRLATLRAFGETIRAEGYTRVILMGMGGSSLAPDVFSRTFGPAPGHPDLTVLDSTHPASVVTAAHDLDLTQTLFVVSSKSGTTVEPLSFFRYFWEKAGRVMAEPGRNFVAITDPGTPLLSLARDRKFRMAFEAPPDVGGRYSALSDFGQVPAALLGVDIGRLLESAATAARANGTEVSAGKAPGLRLGAALGEAAPARDKLTFLTSPALRAFPDWLEQLVAESTGKSGKGIVPVAGEPLAPPAVYGSDRLFVVMTLESDETAEVDGLASALEEAGHPLIRVRLADVYELGREMFDWEVAVAAAGSVIGIHPFNQPDVESAKSLARKAMSKSPGTAGALRIPPDALSIRDGASLATAFKAWITSADPKDYLAIQAYLAPNAETTEALQRLRRAVLEKTGLATTLGYGPRFLHSTGQLHKGGPNEILVLQLVDEPVADVSVPETDYTFGELIRAQALGDFQALRQKERRVLRVNLKTEVAEGLARISELASR